MVDLHKLFKEMDVQTADTGMEYNSRVLLIDGMNTFIRSYCAVPTMDDNGNHIGGTAGFLRSLGYITRTLKPTRVIVVFDGKGGSQRRRKIYPDYKAQRKVFTRVNRSYDLTSEEDEIKNMKFQLYSLTQILDCMPVTTIQIDNVEADDIIGYIAKHVESNGGEAIIYSSDKDFIQLASDKIKVFNPIKKKTYTVDEILEKYKTHPKNFVFYRALLGDTSDNITGIYGAGEKTLQKYLPELADPSSNINYDYIVDKYKNEKKVPKVIQTIIAEQAIIERNLQLMDLSEQQLSDDSKLKILNIYNSKINPLDKIALTKAMIRGNIMSNFPNYDDWVMFSITPLNRFANKGEI